MSFFDFLATNYRVESIIGLLSFIIAATLGYLAYHNASKMKGLAEIMKVADTKDKSRLAMALLEVVPAYQIPDLSQDQGFKIVKMQMTQKTREFSEKMKLLKYGITLFTFVLLVICVGSYVSFSRQEPNVTTQGIQSPIVVGDGATINQTEVNRDTSGQQPGIVRDSISSTGAAEEK